MAPTPRCLQCKELTWQPTKHTFCKALRGLLSTEQLRVRIETWSRQGKRAQAEQWEGERNPCCRKKDSNIEIKGCFECSSDVLHCILACFTFPCGNCEILMRTEGTGAVAVRQHHFNNERILDQVNNFVG